VAWSHLVPVSMRVDLERNIAGRRLWLITSRSDTDLGSGHAEVSMFEAQPRDCMSRAKNGSRALSDASGLARPGHPAACRMEEEEIRVCARLLLQRAARAGSGELLRQEPRLGNTAPIIRGLSMDRRPPFSATDILRPAGIASPINVRVLGARPATSPL